MASPTRRAKKETAAVKQQAKAALDEAADTAKDAGEEVRQAADDVRTRVRDAADHVLDAAGETAGTVREALAETGERLAETLRRASERADLRGLQDNIAAAVSSGVTATADVLRDGRIGDVATDLREAARRHPGTFMLGAAVAGFVLGRFLLVSQGDRGRRARR